MRCLLTGAELAVHFETLRPSRSEVYYPVFVIAMELGEFFRDYVDWFVVKLQWNLNDVFAVFVSKLGRQLLDQIVEV